MIFFPNSKINLGLRVLRRREDGYHDLETVFYPIGLSDMLEVVQANVGKSISLKLYGNFTLAAGAELKDDVENNLCYRATKILADMYHLPKLKIYLHKAIPVGAGLGGGSSDCAKTVVAINKLCHLGMSDEQMQSIVAKLGADCAFFVKNKPVIARGIGDKMTEIDLSLKGKKIMIIKPNIFVSTKEAYAGIIPKIPENLTLATGAGIEEIIHSPISNWKDKLLNDFEGSIFKRYPEIGAIKQWFYDQGAIYSAMSGSGSSVYGIFNDDFNLDGIEKNNNFRDYFIWTGVL